VTHRRSDDERKAIQALLDARPSRYGESPTAAVEKRLRRAFPDLDDFELGFGLARVRPLALLPLGVVDPVPRMRALRRAEKRVGLPREAFHQFVSDSIDEFAVADMTNADAIVRAVERRIDAVVAAHKVRARGLELHGLTEYNIRQATDKVRRRRGGYPLQALVARELNVSVPTLKRVAKVFKLGRWPPAPPD
jgi:hypothetical protein